MLNVRKIIPALIFLLWGTLGFAENRPVPIASGCDLSPISAGPLLIEGVPDTDPNRMFLNVNMAFEDGQEYEVNGAKKKSVIIHETMEVGFFRDWLAEGFAPVGGQIKNALPSSCSNVVGGSSSGILTYTPPTGRVQIGVTKRLCTAIDLPCGLPETECHGGRLCCPPEVPTCTTRTPMCRSEQSQDLFSATATIESQISIGFTGDVPDQQVTFGQILTRNDVDTSSGDLLKLLNDVGLLSAFNINMNRVAEEFQRYTREQARVLETGSKSLKIPTADYIYLPKIESVSWGAALARPPNTPPYSIIVKRNLGLPTSLACKVMSCMRQSKEAGILMINSCKFSI